MTIIKETAKTFGAENWPASGPIWVRVTPDGCPLGWRSQPYTGAAAHAIREAGREAAAKFVRSQVGEATVVPVRYHPRHGVTTETWVRVR